LVSIRFPCASKADSGKVVADIPGVTHSEDDDEFVVKPECLRRIFMTSSLSVFWKESNALAARPQSPVAPV
jgi:hypothetical protein